MTLYFGLFAVVTLTLVIVASIRTERAFEYPYFMGATFAAFIGPQAYGLLQHSNYWPAEALTDTFLMCLLCVGACWVGYQVPPSAALSNYLIVRLDRRRLLRGGILSVLIGLYANHLINQFPHDVRESVWTGSITIYGFFAGLVYLGFAICFYCALRWRSKLAFVVAGVASIVPLENALYWGRREPTVMFVLSIALVLYFVRRKKPTRLLVVGCVLSALLLIPTAGQYRSLAKNEPWEALKHLRPLESLEVLHQPEAISELKNAMYLIAATRYTGEYEFGASYWNHTVFRFVPAQIVGLEAKNALTTNGETNVSITLVELTQSGAGFKPPIGATVTGVGDTYWQFGFFGCLFFAGVAALFKTMWCAADDSRIAAQLLYIPMVSSAMRAVTNWSLDLLPGIIYSSLFVGMIILYARERGTEGDRVSALAMSYVETPEAHFGCPQR